MGYYIARTETGKPGEFANLSDAELDAKIEALAVINRANERQRTEGAA
jgi:hypothetical protein